MKKQKIETKIEDDLLPEYDLTRLRVRRLGPERKSFGRSVICLEPDVAEAFPSPESVNQALRLVMQLADTTHKPRAKASGPSKTRTRAEANA